MHLNVAANGPTAAYQLRSTATDGSQTTIDLSGRYVHCMCWCNPNDTARSKHQIGAERLARCLPHAVNHTYGTCRQLLALADVLDLVMAQHPGWVRPGLRPPPPPAAPNSRGAGLLRAAGRAVTAPMR